MTDQAEIDRFFERDMPNAETRPLFDLAKELGVGFYLGYAELTQEKGETRRLSRAVSRSIPAARRRDAGRSCGGLRPRH
jgi:hypothetical protein